MRIDKKINVKADLSKARLFHRGLPNKIGTSSLWTSSGSVLGTVGLLKTFISVRGGGGAAAPPVGEKNSIIRAKLMYQSGKETVKNISLFNILIYLFSPRNSPNLLKLPPSRR